MPPAAPRSSTRAAARAAPASRSRGRRSLRRRPAAARGTSSSRPEAPSARWRRPRCPRPRQRVVERHPEVGRDERERDRRDEPRATLCFRNTSDRDRRECREAEARDRQQPLGNSGRLQGRIPPEQAIAGQVRRRARAARDDRAEPEHEREPARGRDCVSETQAPRRPRSRPAGAASRGRRSARTRPGRGQRKSPTVAEYARPPRTAARRRHASESAQTSTPPATPRRGARAQPRPPAGDRVREHERDRAEGEVHLAGERDRGERGRGEPRLPALDAVEGEREQHRDRPEQVARRLSDAVGREREREPADEGGAERQAERPQPQRREAARADVRQQDEDVPACHRPEAAPAAARRRPRTASPRS